jgi:hypothetical protein
MAHLGERTGVLTVAPVRFCYLVHHYHSSLSPSHVGRSSGDASENTGNMALGSRKLLTSVTSGGEAVHRNRYAICARAFWNSVVLTCYASPHSKCVLGRLSGCHGIQLRPLLASCLAWSCDRHGFIPERFQQSGSPPSPTLFLSSLPHLMRIPLSSTAYQTTHLAPVGRWQAPTSCQTTQVQPST